MSMFTGITLMGRKVAEAKMESTCVITRAGTPTVDPATGAETPSVTTIYTGKCSLRMADARSNEVAAAGQSIEVQSPTLSLPVTGSGNVRTDDVATITSSLDGNTVIARIAGFHTQTHSTARRFPVQVESA